MVKDLGVTVYCNLKYNQHIDNIVGRRDVINVEMKIKKNVKNVKKVEKIKKKCL